MLSDKTIFITGGAGFMAAALIKRLIRANRIYVYDNLSRNSLKESGLWNHPNLAILQGDIRDYPLLRMSIPADVHVVLHMAAVDVVTKDPLKTLEVNVLGAYNLLRALIDLRMADRIERFVNFSSSEVLGIRAFRADEESPTQLQAVGEARSTYAVSKLAGDHMVHTCCKQLGLRAVSLRPFNIYGPGQVGQGAVNVFVGRAINDEPLIIHGEGDQIRSWCYIDDMVEGILLCLEKEEAIGQVFNMGNPKATTTVLGLAERVVQLTGSSAPIIRIPIHHTDAELRIPSIKKASSLLGFQPRVDLDEGLAQTIEWYRTRITPSDARALPTLSPR